MEAYSPGQPIVLPSDSTVRYSSVSREGSVAPPSRSGSVTSLAEYEPYDLVKAASRTSLYSSSAAVSRSSSRDSVYTAAGIDFKTRLENYANSLQQVRRDSYSTNLGYSNDYCPCYNGSTNRSSGVKLDDLSHVRYEKNRLTGLFSSISARLRDVTSKMDSYARWGSRSTSRSRY
ncbi:hypothetical protein AAVH_16196 [Aphelenchoides avenae]|nr:hypothetical protein AAVH_16196 [Aphelenchus avenae]